jgi:hypothetical protein
MGKALKHFTEILNKNRMEYAFSTSEINTDPSQCKLSQNRRWKKLKHKKTAPEPDWVLHSAPTCVTTTDAENVDRSVQQMCHSGTHSE